MNYSGEASPQLAACAAALCVHATHGQWGDLRHTRLRHTGMWTSRLAVVCYPCARQNKKKKTKKKKHFFLATTQNTVPPSCDFSSPRNMNAVRGNIVVMMLAMTWRLSLLPRSCSPCLRLIAVNFCPSLLLTTRLAALQPGLLLQRLMGCHFIELLFMRCWQVGTRPGDFAAGILR